MSYFTVLLANPIRLHRQRQLTLVASFFHCDREVTLLMLGLTNSGKTSILQRINGNYHNIHVLTFHQLMKFFSFFFLRQRTKCDALRGMYSGWAGRGKFSSDNPQTQQPGNSHVEWILRNVAQCGVRGGLRRSQQDEGDEKDFGESPQSPVRFGKACTNVSWHFILLHTPRCSRKS